MESYFKPWRSSTFVKMTVRVDRHLSCLLANQRLIVSSTNPSNPCMMMIMMIWLATLTSTHSTVGFTEIHRLKHQVEDGGERVNSLFICIYTPSAVFRPARGSEARELFGSYTPHVVETTCYYRAWVNTRIEPKGEYPMAVRIESIMESAWQNGCKSDDKEAHDSFQVSVCPLSIM